MAGLSRGQAPYMGTLITIVVVILIVALILAVIGRI